MAAKKKTAVKVTKAVKPKGEFVIARCTKAGVHAGYLEQQTGEFLFLRDARRIWYWNGAASLSEIAVYGTNPSKRDTNRFCAVVASHRLRQDDVCEVIACTPDGQRCIQEMPVWRA